MARAGAQPEFVEHCTEIANLRPPRHRRSESSRDRRPARKSEPPAIAARQVVGRLRASRARVARRARPGRQSETVRDRRQDRRARRTPGRPSREAIRELRPRTVGAGASVGRGPDALCRAGRAAVLSATHGVAGKRGDGRCSCPHRAGSLCNRRRSSRFCRRCRRRFRRRSFPNQGVSQPAIHRDRRPPACRVSSATPTPACFQRHLRAGAPALPPTPDALPPLAFVASPTSV